MKVLLDECVDSRLAGHISGHVVSTVASQGWGGISNGKLLALAQAEFDIFVTVDRNLSFQQNLPSFTIAVILLSANSNRINDLVALSPRPVERHCSGACGNFDSCRPLTKRSRQRPVIASHTGVPSLAKPRSARLSADVSPMRLFAACACLLLTRLSLAADSVALGTVSSDVPMNYAPIECPKDAYCLHSWWKTEIHVQ